MADILNRRRWSSREIQALADPAEGHLRLFATRSSAARPASQDGHTGLVTMSHRSRQANGGGHSKAAKVNPDVAKVSALPVRASPAIPTARSPDRFPLPRAAENRIFAEGGRSPTPALSPRAHSLSSRSTTARIEIRHVFFEPSGFSLGSHGGLRSPSNTSGMIPGEFRLLASARCSRRRSS